MRNYQHIIKELNIIGGSKGIFDVVVNGEMLYSKHQEGRHAHEGEVLDRFIQLIGPDVMVYGT
ncbi:MAG: Rdx family protein [Anaerolineae bacterium]|nr:Rdx family protein [Anaerolineae bacterium]